MITTNEVAELFAQGFDCSQVIVSYFAEDLGIDDKAAKKMAACFGAGMFAGETCGAYAGALMVIGLKYGHYEPNTPDVKNQNIGKLMEFKQKFAEKHNSCVCKNLLDGLNPSIPEDMNVLLESGKMMSFCPQLVVDIIEVLEKIL